MVIRSFLIHALSPVHAGTGQSVDVIDLPIARMSSTGIPIIPGSSIKGCLRDTLTESLGDKLEVVFGPDSNNASDHAGAAVFSDARLLALPVRSFRGTFAWVSSPLLLSLARRDLKEAGLDVPKPGFATERRAYIGSSCLNTHTIEGVQRCYLEDLDLPVRMEPWVDAWSALLAPLVAGDSHVDSFKNRFVVVDDETMTFLWETATQVDARVSIDSETRTARDGALWYEESLPPETLLIGLLATHHSLKPKVQLEDKEVMELVLGEESIVQFGGKASVGRGRCRLLSLSA
ncbi:MAG: type III-B CRISPR module RAMP protein Cmr4 [Deltaproteobacteria bacterium]|nr:type III-B CRISPR module RAMP protein Cmr4 [Deltaproteobacteria bacterium]|tara:strand:- start:4399 stop:5268 length:870 start_codon:yes stop_codon:yes gene_type:complete